MAEETGRSRRRRRGRLIITTALVVIGALVVMIVAGMSLNPRANAMLGLVVFGGMLGALLLFQRLVDPREDGVIEDVAIADILSSDETEL